MHPGLRTAGNAVARQVWDLTLLTVAETAESAMSNQTTSPEVPVDEPSTAQTPPDATDAASDQAPTDDSLPFESPEFGVGGFFPHLEAPTHG